MDTLATSLPSQPQPLQQPQDGDHGVAEGHTDARLFGLATFLVADGMTFAGFFAAYLTFGAVYP